MRLTTPKGALFEAV